MTRQHDEYADLLGAYALHALDAEEHEAVEAHLLECPRCRAEAADHAWVAGHLGNSGQDAPAGVWDRIADELVAAPPRMRLALDSSGGSRVVSLDERRRRRSRVALTIGSAAAAVTLVAGLGVATVQQSQRIDDLQSALQDDGVQRAANVAMLDPAARQLRLSSSDATLAASAVLLPDGTGFLLTGGLPALGADRTYQLWGLTSTGLISLGLLGAQPHEVVPFESRDQVSALAVTNEVAGGVHQSENPPVVIGHFA